MHDALIWMGFVTDAEAADWMDWLTVWQLRIASCTPTGDGCGRRADRAEEDFARPARRRWGRFLKTIRASRWREENRRCCWNWNTKARSCARVWRAGRPGASGGCWRASIATRSTGSAGKSSRSAPANSCNSSPAGSMSMRNIAWKARAAWPKCSRQLAGFEAAGVGVGKPILPRRVRDYKREWLDEVTMIRRVRLGPAVGRRRERRSASRRSASSRASSSTTGSRMTEATTDARDVRRRPAIYSSRCGRGAMFPQNLQQGRQSGARACRDGPGRSGGARLGHLRFVCRAAADDHAAVSRRQRAAAAGRPLVLLPPGPADMRRMN